VEPVDLLDTGTLRYGVSTAEKEKLARGGALPGAPVDKTADQERADRYASGYLFATRWPRLSSAVMPLINALKTSDIPFLGGDSPEIQSYAQNGVNRALIDRGNIYTTPTNRSARPWEDYALQAAHQAEALKK
jgi:hypothetical protein